MTVMAARRVFGAIVTALLATSVTLGATVAAAAPTPPGVTISGPVTGGLGRPAGLTTSFDLARVGYQQHEFLVSGTASSYTSATPLTSDGRWNLTPASSVPYTTRIIVNRPSDPRKFNGTVFVEWMNVSIGSDVGVDWAFGHNELIRRGDAWVGVSAQAVGVNASKSADPVRYASLSHPGDSYSYDMFTQAGQVVRGHAATVLGGLIPARVIASGESQSAARMVTYIDGIQPIAHVFDGFLVHSRGSSGAPLSQTPQAAVPTPALTKIRTDGTSKVLVLQSETDVNEGARQDDSATFRLWEMAGTSHVDGYVIGVGLADVGDGQTEVAMFEGMRHPPSIGCTAPMNMGPSHLIVESAMRRLSRWIRSGIEPPKAPRLEVVSFGPTVYARDANGNVRGGIRTPHVDAPIAVVTNEGQSGPGLLCRLSGATFPFDAAKLHSLYKGHDSFVDKWVAATNRAVIAGFLLPADARPVTRAAIASTIPG